MLPLGLVGMVVHDHPRPSGGALSILQGHSSHRFGSIDGRGAGCGLESPVRQEIAFGVLLSFSRPLFS